jgi:micrococcal nuclease
VIGRLLAVALVAAPLVPRLLPGPSCTVSRIVDGDTFYCDGALKVRLLGIDAPEHGQGRIGRESAAALRALMPPGTLVRLEGDVVARDRWGRRLAYVWADSVLVNEAMVRGGWAMLFTWPPNVKYAKRLERAQRSARQARAGLWRENGFTCSPAAWRHRRC